MSTQTVTNMPFEEAFRCCICLDTYKKPVSIPCGHNFCLKCIEGFWDMKNKWECPLCKRAFTKRPEPSINLEFANMIEMFQRYRPPTITPEEDVDGGRDDPNKADEVPCDICLGNKSTSVRSCLVCQASYCQLHLTSHLSDPALQRHRLMDPATFPTSHLCKKHSSPLIMFCKKEQRPVCVKCTERFHKHHETVHMENESKKIMMDLRETKADIQKMVHNRLRKMEQIKHSMDLSKKITEREIQGCTQVCTLLMTAIQRQHTGMVEELQERQEEAESRAERLLLELEQEINDLQTRSSELQHLELAKHPLHLLQSFPSLSKLPSTKEWSEVDVYTDNCMGTVRRAISKLVDICQDLGNKLSAEEANKLDQYAVDITLDPETASGWLVLSTDKKKVTSSQKKALLPDIPQRFNSCVCVLGEQSFTSGRRYWVVQVGDKTDWDLGVAKESINRKGVIAVRPDSGYWAICRRKGGSLSACAGPSVTLNLQEIPQKVGVFLDCEEGSVSFYNEEAKTLIYTYSGCNFSEHLYPYFNPCVQENGKNTVPLIICPLDGHNTESDV